MASVRIENAIVKGVSSPDTIKRIAREQGINPQEVFVRLVFEYNGTDYTASNKLRFIGKEDYNKLLEAKEVNGIVDITVDTDKEFFYMNNGTTVDDLFSEELPKREKTSLAGLIK